MSSIDQRVVEMKFNYSAFAKGIADTLASLTKLQDGLKLSGASQGFSEAESGAQQLGDSTGRVGASFTAMQAMAFGALASIGAKAVQTGEQLIKSLTVDPLKSGLDEYATNMNSIQTILANTQVSGAGLPEVNAALDDLNNYSDKTIYNFSEMAKNIGTFTAAGVGLDASTNAIKGIANLAALSGSNSQQASSAMYQLSQALASGKVSLMDWNSVVNAGMGGTVFQRALAQTAVQMGSLSESAVTLDGDMQNVKISGESFRDSISAEGGGPSWLTSDVLTSTLKQFTGDMTDAELATQGFSAEQIKAIQTQAKTAMEAATQVKTLSQVFDVAKETAGSGWAMTWRLIFGDFEEAKKTFTGLSNWLNGFISSSADARNNLLKGWRDIKDPFGLGGREVLLQGLKQGAEDLGRVIQPVIMAFREIFPKKTAQDLFNFTTGFRALTLALRPSAETFDNIRRTAAGVFAVFGIVVTVVKSAAKAFFTLFDGINAGGSGGALLSFTAKIGDFLVHLNRVLKTGDDLDKFFMGIANVIRVPIDAIRALIGWVKGLFDGMDMQDSAGSAFAGVFDPIIETGDRLNVIGQRIMAVLKTIGQAIRDFVGQIGGYFGEIPKLFSGVQWDFSADTIMKALGIGAGVGLGALILKALKDIKKVISGFDMFGSAGGTFSKLKDALDGITGTLKGMQQNLQAAALLKIAGAIGIMALSVLVLAGIDSAGLVRASLALTVMFTQLGVALQVFSKIGSVSKAVKITIMGVALMFLATAILILTAAVKALSDMNWGELTKGLAGVVVLIGALAGAAQLMSTKNGVMIKTGASLALLAIAIRILVSAVEELATMSWADLAKGIAGVAVLLGALGLFAKFAEANSGGVSQGLGVVLLAVALKLLASAVGDFAQYNWEELAQGMVGIGAGLALIAGALKLIPEKSALAKGLAIAVIAYSLRMIASAVQEMASMSWVEMAKGLLVMDIALGSIAATLDSLGKGSLVNALAIFVVATSLGLIADALVEIGGMSVGGLVKGLIGLAAALTIISIGLASMEEALPGAAALLVAAASLWVIYPILKGFSEMSWPDLLKGLAGLAGVFLILAVAGLVLAPLGLIFLAVGAGIGLLGLGVVLAAAGTMLFATALTALAASGAAGVAAFKVILTTFISLIPIMMKALGEGIVAFAHVITEGAPAFLEAFVAVLTSLLQAVIDITPKLVETFLTLLAAVFLVIYQAVPQMVLLGLTLLLAFLNGIASMIGTIVTAAVNIIVNFLNGIRDNIGRIVKAGADLIIAFMNGLADQVPRVVRAAFQMIIDINHGIADAIREKSDELIASGLDIVDAIIDGIVKGVKQLGGKAISAVKGLAGDMVNGAKDFLHINSPSKVFRDVVGKAIPEGIAVGVDKYGYMATDSTVAMGRDMLNEMGKTISGLGNMVGGMDEFNPTITPVLDLSAVQQGAGNISDILGAAPIDLSNATSSASRASAEYSAALEAMAESVGANAGTTVTLTQINNSPKALSSAEIYRNTNNQISQAKGALTNAN